MNTHCPGVLPRPVLRRAHMRHSSRNVGSVTWHYSLVVTVMLMAFLPARTDAVSWILKIEPYDEECYLLNTHTTMKSISMLTGDYELIDDGGTKVSADPLLVYVMEATKEEKILWKSIPGAQGDTFKIPVTAGKGYWICLQNSSHGPDDTSEEPEHPDHVARLIGFTYKMTGLHDKPAPLVFTAEDKNDWLTKSELVEMELRVLMNHHSYMRTREANHRSLVENTFAEILTWTLVEAGMVCMIAVGQIMYFRHFLEKKRYM